MIMGRHTLEHIPQTRSFLQTVRRALGDRANIIVFFEVPDTTRVLDEAAFWDVYYEHCSYFTPGSLARLFRSCGFEVLALTQEFDRQYLLIEARLATTPQAKTHCSEESLSDLAQRVKSFAGGAARSIMAWQTRLRREHAAGKRVAIWGSGSKCVSFLTALQLHNEIGALIDVNPHRHGKFLPRVAREVLPPQSLRDLRPDLVLVMNPVYLQEVREMLVGMRLTAEVLPVENEWTR
jgi:hypothetical protein